MLPGMTALTARRSGTRATLRPDAVGPDLTLEARAGRGQGISGDLFVDVDRLGMLTEIVQPREATGAMALKRALARVFANVPREMLAPGEAQSAWREVGAEEPLALFLLLGRSRAVGIVCSIRLRLALVGSGGLVARGGG